MILPFRADHLGCKHAGPVQIEPGVEHLLEERIDGFCMLLRDMAVAHVLPDHAGILALGQGVVVAVACA